MSVFIHVPVQPLSSFVEHFWFLDGHVSEENKYQLFPDGGIEVMFNLGAPQWLFEPNRNQGKCFRTAWVSGMRTKSIVISHGSVASMIGVRFRPAGAHRFLHVPMQELANRVIELDCLWGRDAEQSRERLAAAPSAAACFAQLERILILRLAESNHEFRVATWVAEQLRHQPNQDIDNLADQSGISSKQIQRMFRKVVGIRPKAFARIQRFQAAIREIKDRPAVDWASLAAFCGYYDQPHFIREFKDFTEMTPTTYFAKRGPYENSVAVD